MTLFSGLGQYGLYILSVYCIAAILLVGGAFLTWWKLRDLERSRPPQ